MVQINQVKLIILALVDRVKFGLNKAQRINEKKILFTAGTTPAGHIL